MEFAVNVLMRIVFTRHSDTRPFHNSRRVGRGRSQFRGEDIQIASFLVTVQCRAHVSIPIFFFKLSGQRVYNLSRTPKSQVQQTLRVSYDDGPKIHQFLQSIKIEVQKLPKLITDGSR